MLSNASCLMTAGGKKYFKADCSPAGSISSLFPLKESDTRPSPFHLSYRKVCQPQGWTGFHSIHQRRPQRRGRSDRIRFLSHCRNPRSCPGRLSSDRYCPALLRCRSQLLSSQTRTQAENWPHSPPQRRCLQGCTALVR